MAIYVVKNKQCTTRQKVPLQLFLRHTWAAFNIQTFLASPHGTNPIWQMFSRRNTNVSWSSLSKKADKNEIMNPLPSTFSNFCLDYIYFVELDEFYWKSGDSTRHYTWIRLYYSWILIVKLNYVWIMICFIIHEKLRGNSIQGMCSGDQVMVYIIWENVSLTT